MSDHEDVTNTQKKAKSPEVLKQLRRSAKANLTRLLNKIEAKVKSLSSSDVIAILRENLTEQKDQTLLYHTKYVDSACLNDEQRIEARWAARVDDSAIATYKLIDDYLGSIITPEADPPSTQDGSPNGSQNFTQVTRRSTVVMLKPREKELRQRKPSKRLNEKTKSTLVKPLKRKGNSKLTFTKEV